ncbi:MAG: tetratricopeptide repeat protein [Thermoanaerobacteraceae bacterium]|nr:tetratricopeptide repeat protein [Thermoanaerobacteraceae bacterium]
MTLTDAQRLFKKGQKLLEKGEFNKAAWAFAAALEEEDAVPTRNNLAVALFMAGKPGEALEALAPALEGGEAGARAHPFTYALASRLCTALNREEEARAWLDRSVEVFEGLVAEMLSTRGEVPPGLADCTTLILQAAAALKDYPLVLELYRRWKPYHSSPENTFLAGAACFNLGRYNLAAALWSSIAGVHPYSSGLQQVAFLVQRGVIPPFQMNFDTFYGRPAPEKPLEPTSLEEGLERAFQDGYIRMSSLVLILQRGEHHDAAKAAHALVLYGGEWGRKLGLSILDSPLFGRAVKMGAARALVEAGVLPEGEPFSMVLDGQKRKVELKKVPIVTEPNPEVDAVVKKALELRGKGKVDEALKLLWNLYEKGPYSPQAVLTLADLLREKGEVEQALILVQELEELAPGDPTVLFYSAALMFLLDRLEEARQRLGNINRAAVPAELRRKIEFLDQEIQLQELLADLPQGLAEMFEEEERKKIEEKPLPVDPTLARGLKNMPAGWLDAACLRYGLEPARLRRDREKQLIEFLTCRENLERILQEDIEGEDRVLLKYLLRKGGWSRLNAVTRKFGSMEGDGFFWEEKDPNSCLGFLWSRALVMVGRAVIDGRRTKIATIPVELRRPLQEILLGKP